jgi:hypothetical protein
MRVIEVDSQGNNNEGNKLSCRSNTFIRKIKNTLFTVLFGFSCSSWLYANPLESSPSNKFEPAQTKYGYIEDGAEHSISKDGVGISADLYYAIEKDRITPFGAMVEYDDNPMVSHKIFESMSMAALRDSLNGVSLSTPLSQDDNEQGTKQTGPRDDIIFDPELFADFNGDGCQDTASITRTRISIYHPCTRRTKVYTFSGVININGVYDTDGIPGKEIGVILSNLSCLASSGR